MKVRIIALALLASAAMAAAESAPVWQVQTSGTTASLRGIQAVNEEMAWASGTGGTVLRTLDGGAHWLPCAVPDAESDGKTLDFRGVQAVDAETAMVMASGPGEKSRLYKTTDGCKTWKLVLKNTDPEGFWDSLLLKREQRLMGPHEGFGLLFGDSVRGELTLYETRDGGESWQRLHDAALASKGGSFAASNSCIANTNATNDLIFSDSGYAVSVRLNYAGSYWLKDASLIERSWMKTRLPLAADSPGRGAFAISHRVEITHGSDGKTTIGLRLVDIAVGGDYTKPNEAAGTAAYTLDGGLHWLAAAVPPHGYRSTVQWFAQEELWITAGTNGSDWSRDDGRTWQRLEDGNWNALSLPYVVGPKGRIARIDLKALHLVLDSH